MAPRGRHRVARPTWWCRPPVRFSEVVVDSYAFLPRSLRGLYESVEWADHEPVWAALESPVSEARIGLLSTAGIFLRNTQGPFDVERERQEPTWGDPSYRLIPAGVEQSQIDAAHLHLNTADFLIDVDVALPVHRLNELVAQGLVGAAAEEHVSLMGYQEEGAHAWRTTVGPEIAARCHAQAIDALILAPA